MSQDRTDTAANDVSLHARSCFLLVLALISASADASRVNLMISRNRESPRMTPGSAGIPACSWTGGAMQAGMPALPGLSRRVGLRCELHRRKCYLAVGHLYAKDRVVLHIALQYQSRKRRLNLTLYRTLQGSRAVNRIITRL